MSSLLVSKVVVFSTLLLRPAGQLLAQNPPSLTDSANLSGGPNISAKPLIEVTHRDGSRDFDFFLGSWKVHNRRLKHPFMRSTEWTEFEGTSVSRALWSGTANMDEVEFDSPYGHIEGLTVRLYNPTSRQWSLYWSNSATGMFDQPTVGEFKNGVGEFFDSEPYKGRQIFVRYTWSNITSNSCHWEQAFSEDGGRSWETNWTMDFVRRK